MSSFLFGCIGFVGAAIFFAALIVAIDVLSFMLDLPLSLMSHPTLQSLDSFKNEHPWAYRWGAFVSWLENKILGAKGNSLP